MFDPFEVQIRERDAAKGHSRTLVAVEAFLREIAEQVPEEWVEPESSMAMQVTIRTRDLYAALTDLEMVRR